MRLNSEIWLFLGYREKVQIRLVGETNRITARGRKMNDSRWLVPKVQWLSDKCGVKMPWKYSATRTIQIFLCFQEEFGNDNCAKFTTNLWGPFPSCVEFFIFALCGWKTFLEFLWAVLGFETNALKREIWDEIEVRPPVQVSIGFRSVHLCPGADNRDDES